MDWDNPLFKWYQYHREDYDAVQRRLAACRNVMLHGRTDAAARMLEKSCVHSVLSIQTSRGRHERAFTMYYAGGASIEAACNQTVYSNQKADWLHNALANFDFEAAVTRLREGGADAAHEYLVDNFTGLSWTKAGFTLAMCGMWELACPDSRTKDVLGIEGRIRTKADYDDALAAIDDALNVDRPVFIKQWACYDARAEEHARHMAYFREVLPVLRE